MTHFDRLGLPPSYDLDPSRLEAAYLAASRVAHPDHSGNPDDASAVNAAYAALRDPIRRAEYLLGLLGGTLQIEHNPMFLMETMEMRERADAGELDAVEQELNARLAGLFGDLTQQFAADDMTAAGRTLATAKTLWSLRREVVG